MAKLILLADTDNQMIISKIMKDINELEIVCMPNSFKLLAIDEKGLWKRI